MKSEHTRLGGFFVHDVKQAVWPRWTAFSPGPDAEVRIFFAPGRVNLIGEHLDYNGGLVFPAALNLGTWCIVRPRQDSIVRFASTGFEQEVTLDLGDVSYRKEDDYANYPKGVIWALGEAGVKAAGMDVLFHGNLPNGAGLSSSASVEMAMAVAIRDLATSTLDMVELAKLGQKVENQFIGVNSGIMDQFAVAMGKANHALLLHCDTLHFELAPMQIGNYQLVITNTNKRRGLADSKYNERRSECDHALATLQENHPSLVHLAQVTPDEWDEWQAEIDNPVARRRARHVVTENARVVEAAKALSQGDIRHFGQLMRASHESLRDDFEVTGVELDALAEAAWAAPGCVGSRMTGAGFGGCTVSLVAAESVDEFKSFVAKRYEGATGLVPSFYVTTVGDGAREVTAEVLQ